MVRAVVLGVSAASHAAARRLARMLEPSNDVVVATTNASWQWSR